MKYNKIIGSIIGGAAGDALGNPVKYLTIKDILRGFDDNLGIQTYEIEEDFANISYNTQMALFTSKALIYTGRDAEINDYYEALVLSYNDWLRTQYPNKMIKSGEISDLYCISELNNMRDPDDTTINVLKSESIGTLDYSVNNKKTCGAISRAVPIGAYFDSSEIAKADNISALSASITHGNSVAHIVNAILSHIINRLVNCENETILSAVESAEEMAEENYSDSFTLFEILSVIDIAIDLVSEEDILDVEAIEEIGSGWNSEEVLGIAIYCSIKYADDFEKAVIASVNHSGDSSTCGFITGGIVGASLGYECIPENFLERLELKDILIETGNELAEK